MAAHLVRVSQQQAAGSIAKVNQKMSASSHAGQLTCLPATLRALMAAGRQAGRQVGRLLLTMQQRSPTRRHPSCTVMAGMVLIPGEAVLVNDVLVSHQPGL